MGAFLFIVFLLLIGPLAVRYGADSRLSQRPRAALGLDGRRRAAAIVAALGVVYVVWGSTYLGIAYAIETLPPFLMAGTRFLVAGAILYAAARLVGGAGVRASGRPDRTQWGFAALTGVLMLGVGNGGVSWAQQTVPSGIAAIVIAEHPAVGRRHRPRRVRRAALVARRRRCGRRLRGRGGADRPLRAGPDRPGRRHRAPRRGLLLGHGDAPLARAAADGAAARRCRDADAVRRRRARRRGAGRGRARRRPGAVVALGRSRSPTSSSSARCSRSAPTPGCCATRRCRSSPRTRT